MSRPAAIFDVDRTLFPRASLESLFIRHLVRSGEFGWRDAVRSLGFLASHAGKIPSDRLFKENKAYLRGRPAERFNTRCRDWIEKSVAAELSGPGLRILETHRSEGMWIILLTGTLEPLALSLAEQVKADVVLACRLETWGGVFTGSTISPHPYGDGKWEAFAPVVEARGIDLARSHAYADSPADLPILERVGRPHAVSPGRVLRRIAVARGWDILAW